MQWTACADAEEWLFDGLTGMDQPDIHGLPPDLAGRSCGALLCEQHWHDGLLDEPANVIFLNVSQQWHWLYFDCGIIFWRRASGPPEPYTMDELGSAIRIDDLGSRLDIAGRRIESVDASPIPGGSQVRFQFQGNRSVTFRDVDDSTSIVYMPTIP